MFHIAQYFPITDPTLIFFVVLLIILFAPIIMGKLRIPHIIGMVLAGVLIGKYGLNILERDASFELFGKVGLYYIMFLAALEMDMEGMKKNKSRLIIYGLLTCFVPFFLTFGMSIWLLHYSTRASFLLSCIMASNTLIAYPIVSRYGLQQKPSVTLSVGSSMISLLIALIMLAGLVASFSKHDGVLFWVFFTLKFAAYCGVMIILIPRLTRWFLRRYSDAVMQFIFVLSMLFMSAALSQIVGIEGVFGAFFAGLILNRYIPHVSPLMNRLEFIGNALFIPYFLIGVGMLIDVHVIFGHGDALKVAAVMIVVALAGKWIACWLTQKIYKMGGIERELMYGLSNAQAAATLAAVLVGYNIILPNEERLLNDDVLNGTVLLILVTCIVSSFITERAARKIAMEEAHLEENRSVEAEKILIPIANPDTIEDLINLSLVIRDPKQRDNLLALNVINDDSSSESAELRGKRYLEKAAMITASADVPLRQITRYDLNIASGIIHTAKEYAATDVVIGLHRKVNIVDSFFGMLTENLLKGLHREVMVSKFLMPINTIRRVIVAVPPKAEYEAGFLKWVEHFCRLGSTLGCRVHFYANEETTAHLQGLVKAKYGQTLTDFSRLDDWGDLLILTGQVNFDHLLVIISARRGSISYDSSFEKLPAQISKYFANNSLIVLYPDQLGEPQDAVSFSNPRGNNESQHYEKVGKWFYKWFKKN